MTYIYITGDRAASPMTAALIVHQTLQNIFNVVEPKDAHIITCNGTTGIEAAVQYLVPKEMLTVVKRDMNSEGHLDFDTAHKLIAGTADAVFVLHPDPLSSRISQSAAQIFKADIIQYPITASQTSSLSPEDFFKETGK